MRYFAGAFLLLWLAGWAVGETLALGVLVAVIRSAVGGSVGAPWPIPEGEWIAGGAGGLVFVFLLIWLTVWTVGGFAAIKELLRSLAGEDRILVESLGMELQRRAGPFRRTQTFQRSQLRRVRLRRHDNAVVIDTARGSELVTAYGTEDERRAMVQWLRARLLLQDGVPAVEPNAAPPGWTMKMEGGTARLTQDNRRARAVGGVIVWLVALTLGAIAIGADGSLAGQVVLWALVLLLTSTATWIVFSRRSWLASRGRLTHETRFFATERARAFQSARLEVSVSTDSDNDTHYQLDVIDAQGRRKIAGEIHDETPVLMLGQWLAERTGFRLILPHQLR